MHAESRWREVDDLFRRALDRPVADRAPFVRAASGDDRFLRDRVLALLDLDARAEGFLEASVEEYCDLPWQRVFEAGARHVDDGAEDDDRVGERVGAYRLDRRVGRGGMASVYLASRADGQFDQQVAIKLLRRGLDTDDVIRRFLAERQILSSLSHPNIARVFDGGATSDGLPYLVMEYVEGIPLLAWCDERTLSIEERLRLFCQVGRAVQHAHRSLVVHRDLKPSNILVDRRGTVKLLDFGIAKVLEEDPAAEVTIAGLRAMTPAYASPELIRGDPITTASDVYQLGLLLCQLLAGRLPYDVGALSPARAERLILEARPARPSALVRPEIAEKRGVSERTLSRVIHGDLDLITLEALRTEPEDRYPSAEALVDDVERHLRGEPVRARAPEIRYRMRKFVRRHRVGVAAASAVFTILLAAAIVSTWQARRLAVERDRAVAHEQASAQVTEFLSELFRVTDPNLTGGEEIDAIELLDEGARRALVELANQPAVQAEVLSTIGVMYLRRGVLDAANPLLERVVAYRREADDPESLALALVDLSRSVSFRDRDRSVALLEEAILVARQELGSGHRTLAVVLTELAQRLNTGPRAEAAAEEALTILRGHPGDVRRELADILHFTGRGGDSRELGRLQEALEIRRELSGGDYNTGISAILNDMALKVGSVDPLAADTLMEKAAEINTRIHGREHWQTLTILNNLAGQYRDRGDYARAEPLYREILETRERVYPDNLGGIAYTKHGLGWSLTELGRAEEAEPLLRDLVAFMTPDDGGTNRVHQVSLSALGWSLAGQRRYEEAEPLLVGPYRWLVENDPDAANWIAVTLDRVIRLYERWGRPSLAAGYRSQRLALERGEPLEAARATLEPVPSSTTGADR